MKTAFCITVTALVGTILGLLAYIGDQAPTQATRPWRQELTHFCKDYDKVLKQHLHLAVTKLERRDRYMEATIPHSLWLTMDEAAREWTGAAIACESQLGPFKIVGQNGVQIVGIGEKVAKRF